MEKFFLKNNHKTYIYILCFIGLLVLICYFLLKKNRLKTENFISVTNVNNVKKVKLLYNYGTDTKQEGYRYNDSFLALKYIAFYNDNDEILDNMTITSSPYTVGFVGPYGNLDSVKTLSSGDNGWYSMATENSNNYISFEFNSQQNIKTIKVLPRYDGVDLNPFGHYFNYTQLQLFDSYDNILKISKVFTTENTKVDDNPSKFTNEKDGSFVKFNEWFPSDYNPSQPTTISTTTTAFDPYVLHSDKKIKNESDKLDLGLVRSIRDGSECKSACSASPECKGFEIFQINMPYKAPCIFSKTKDSDKITWGSGTAWNHNFHSKGPLSIPTTSTTVPTTTSNVCSQQQKDGGCYSNYENTECQGSTYNSFAGEPVRCPSCPSGCELYSGGCWSTSSRDSWGSYSRQCDDIGPCPDVDCFPEYMSSGNIECVRNIPVRGYSPARTESCRRTTQATRPHRIPHTFQAILPPTTQPTSQQTTQSESGSSEMADLIGVLLGLI